jgi:hypothetical protein
MSFVSHLCKKCDAITMVEEDYIFENCKKCILKEDGLNVTYRCPNGHLTTLNRLDRRTFCSTCMSNQLEYV